MVAKSQRGQAVKGSISVARAGSRVKVELLAKPSALGRKGSKQIKVGSSTKSAGAGTATFTVNLNSAAKKALRSKRKLAADGQDHGDAGERRPVHARRRR